jgi:hypothetical protein
MYYPNIGLERREKQRNHEVTGNPVKIKTWNLSNTILLLVNKNKMWQNIFPLNSSNCKGTQ